MSCTIAISSFEGVRRRILIDETSRSVLETGQLNATWDSQLCIYYAFELQLNALLGDTVLNRICVGFVFWTEYGPARCRFKRRANNDFDEIRSEQAYAAVALFVL